MYTLNLDNMTTGEMTEYFGTHEEMVQRFDLEAASFEREGWINEALEVTGDNVTCQWVYEDGATVVVTLCEAE